MISIQLWSQNRIYSAIILYVKHIILFVSQLTRTVRVKMCVELYKDAQSIVKCSYVCICVCFFLFFPPYHYFIDLRTVASTKQKETEQKHRWRHLPTHNTRTQKTFHSSESLLCTLLCYTFALNDTSIDI